MPWQTRVAVAACVAVLLVVLVSRRLLRAPPTLGPWLAESGLQLQRMERRWLTRGPFPDIRPAGIQHSGWLMHVLVRDRAGKLASGWVWLPPRWRWESPDRWRLQLDPGVVSKPGGIGTGLFMSLVAISIAAVLLVVYAIARQHP